jgi:hypothetical protein
MSRSNSRWCVLTDRFIWWAVQDSNLRPPACKYSHRLQQQVAARAKTAETIALGGRSALSAIPGIFLLTLQNHPVLWGNLWGNSAARAGPLTLANRNGALATILICCVPRDAARSENVQTRVSGSRRCLERILRCESRLLGYEPNPAAHASQLPPAKAK